MANKKCPKPDCNGELIWKQVHGSKAEEWYDDKYYECNKCGYGLPEEEYKKL